MNNKFILFLTLLSSSVFAQKDEASIDLKKEIKSRSGYEVDNIGYGGRSSVGKQLYLDDIFIPDHLRFPEFDKSLQPYYLFVLNLKIKLPATSDNGFVYVTFVHHNYVLASK